MALERELETYRRELPRLLGEGSAGKWVAVLGEDLLGVFPTMEGAFEAGLERFGDRSFLVKEVVEKETPFYFTRNIRPCRS
jgi:hypothetical protein